MSRIHLRREAKVDPDSCREEIKPPFLVERFKRERKLTPVGETQPRERAAALRDAKIEDFRFHDLRHTAATRLADAGTDAFTIAAILGHSTIQMSARYTHATDERKRRAVERMSESQNLGHIPVTQIEAAS